MTDKYRIQVLNNISAGGLKRLPWDRFAVSADVGDPHAILVRSADLHNMEIPESLLAVGRAGTSAAQALNISDRDRRVLLATQRLQTAMLCVP